MSTLADYARDHRSADLVVIRRGEVVIDEAWEQTPDPIFPRTPRVDGRTRQDVASVQKSFTATLIGIAIANGELQVTDTMTQHLGKGWTGRNDVPTESQITIEHMLSMTSGLGPSLEFVANPGERWDYNLTVYPLLKRALTAATDRSLSTLTSVHITQPLGLANTGWVDREWNDALPAMLKPAFFYPDGEPMEALHSNARDLATFGEAIRKNRLPIDPAFAQAMREPSQELNPSYGWLWWVRADGYAALGAGDQCCVVIPSHELVLARTGGAAEPIVTGPTGFIDNLVNHAKEAFA